MRYLLLWSMVLLALVPGASLAQDAPPVLDIRLRDVAGVGIPGVTVELRDRSGTTVLARATTDRGGMAAFGTLPINEVRVHLAGRLPDGTPLQLPGQDRGGIALTVAAPLRLEVRSETDGTVRPDPATELALEPGVAIDDALTPFDPATIPTAPRASVPTIATTPAGMIAVVPTPVVIDVPPPAPHTQAPLWPGYLLLGLVLLGLAAVLLVQWRGRGPR